MMEDVIIDISPETQSMCAAKATELGFVDTTEYLIHLIQRDIEAHGYKPDNYASVGS